jgi:sortase B
MKSGNMFGRLRKYKESEYFYKHRMISFDSIYEDGQYAVFAVMEMETVPGTARWYDLWSLATDSYAKREEAIRTLEKRSLISGVLDVRADDQILLLVTCLDGNTERLVVAARRLRDNETANTLTLRQEQ